ncbi:MAG: DUF4270 family protein [Ferruginibacter sp.]
MQIKILRLSIAALAYFSFFITGCTKIDTTELGADLIPAVDNIHTFADTLDVIGTAGQLSDTSTRLSGSENHVVGRINDPVFGNTSADMFLQLSPDFFPYYFGAAKDTFSNGQLPGTKFDSVVFCLAYKGFYGDTLLPQNLKVYALDPNTNFKDSSYKLDFVPDMPYSGNLLGQATVIPADLGKKLFIRHGKDSVTNQIRIKLSGSFITLLNSMDSGSVAGANAFHSDSIFKTFFKGFAVVADNSVGGVGGLFQVSLTDPLTRLEFHYTRKNGAPLDTSYSSFTFSVGSTAQVGMGAQANLIKRDNSGSEFPNSPSADALYVQSTPGSSVYLNIPELTNYPNRIIHRAEIIMEQIPGDPTIEKSLTPPSFLYVDIVDTPATTLKFKPVYYDLSPNSFYNPDDINTFFPSGGIDHIYYGGFLRTTTDGFGTRAYYTFNLTRYVQNLITKDNSINYKLRVSAPYKLNYYNLNLLYSNNLAAGRVKLANNNHSGYKLRMRIVYSNLP